MPKAEKEGVQPQKSAEEFRESRSMKLPAEVRAKVGNIVWACNNAQDAATKTAEFLLEPVCGFCGGYGLGTNECSCIHYTPITRAQFIHQREAK